MLVVIEVEDWDDNDGLLRELRVLQAGADGIASDPDYDPDDDGAPLALRTSDARVEIGVGRIVGTVDEREVDGYRPDGTLGSVITRAIRPLES